MGASAERALSVPDDGVSPPGRPGRRAEATKTQYIFDTAPVRLSGKEFASTASMGGIKRPPAYASWPKWKRRAEVTRMTYSDVAHAARWCTMPIVQPRLLVRGRQQMTQHARHFSHFGTTPGCSKFRSKSAPLVLSVVRYHWTGVESPACRLWPANSGRPRTIPGRTRPYACRDRAPRQSRDAFPQVFRLSILLDDAVRHR